MRGAAVTFAHRLARRVETRSEGDGEAGVEEASDRGEGRPVGAGVGGRDGGVDGGAGGGAGGVAGARSPRRPGSSGGSDPPAPWDVVVASDMLDLAAFRGLAPEPVARLPAVVYFHENQLTYPVPAGRGSERDLHFALTNLTTALAADAVWFNSAFHRDEWLGALPGLLARLPDHRPRRAVERIRAKSRVEPPGVEMPGADRPGLEVPAAERRGIHPSAQVPPASGDPGDHPSGGTPRAERPPGPLRLLWAARWEHDKAPERFFAALDRLRAKGVDFRLSVLGQSFRDVPPVFAAARERFADRIDHWGWQERRADYETALAAADVVVSTADHEFFGLAVVEAVAAGCFPLLPDRLAYPEVLASIEGGTGEHLYAPRRDVEGRGGGSRAGEVVELADRLASLAARLGEGDGTRRALWAGDPMRGWRAVRRFGWPRRAAALDDALEVVVGEMDPPPGPPRRAGRG